MNKKLSQVKKKHIHILKEKLCLNFKWNAFLLGMYSYAYLVDVFQPLPRYKRVLSEQIVSFCSKKGEPHIRSCSFAITVSFDNSKKFLTLQEKEWTLEKGEHWGEHLIQYYLLAQFQANYFETTWALSHRSLAKKG